MKRRHLKYNYFLLVIQVILEIDTYLLLATLDMYYVAGSVVFNLKNLEQK